LRSGVVSLFLLQGDVPSAAIKAQLKRNVLRSSFGQTWLFAASEILDAPILFQIADYYVKSWLPSVCGSNPRIVPKEEFA
jgi:hypothetical protein